MMRSFLTGYEANSLTRKGPRIEVLPLLSALAAFATWLVGTKPAVSISGSHPFDQSDGFTRSCVWGARRWCDDGCAFPAIDSWNSYGIPHQRDCISLARPYENVGIPQALTRLGLGWTRLGC